DAGGVAIHHEADSAGGCQYCDLRVAVAVLLAVSESFVPALLRGCVESGRDVALINVVDAGSVHADDVEERFAIEIPAGASGSGQRVGAEICFRQTLLR